MADGPANSASPKDPVVLVADKNMEEGMRGLLSRHSALGIRPLSYDLYTHPHHDPGCLNDGAEFLRAFARRYHYALVMFDREGCGSAQPREDLVAVVQVALARSGWDGRSATIVLDPELEVWVWSDSPHVEEVLGWRGGEPGLRTWLQGWGYLQEGESKPARPKEALEAALRQAGKPRSSTLYRRLAERVSLTGHEEVAFTELCRVLRAWFPVKAE